MLAAVVTEFAADRARLVGITRPGNLALGLRRLGYRQRRVDAEGTKLVHQFLGPFRFLRVDCFVNHANLAGEFFTLGLKFRQGQFGQTRINRFRHIYLFMYLGWFGRSFLDHIQVSLKKEPCQS